jgi:hypothetical protein
MRSMDSYNLEFGEKALNNFEIAIDEILLDNKEEKRASKLEIPKAGSGQEPGALEHHNIRDELPSQAAPPRIDNRIRLGFNMAIVTGLGAQEFFRAVAPVEISTPVMNALESRAQSLGTIWRSELKSSIQNLKGLTDTVPGFHCHNVSSLPESFVRQMTNRQQYEQYRSWSFLSGHNQRSIFPTFGGLQNEEYIAKRLSLNNVGKAKLVPLDVQSYYYALPENVRTNAQNWNEAVYAHNSELSEARRFRSESRGNMVAKEMGAFMAAQLGNELMDKYVFTGTQRTMRTDLLDLGATALMFAPRINVWAKAGAISLTHFAARSWDRYDQEQR